MMAGHSIDESHHIKFKGTMVLIKKADCMDCIVKEATEIQLHPDNFNDMEFTPS
jgi:hypothetical protein